MEGDDGGGGGGGKGDAAVVQAKTASQHEQRSGEWRLEAAVEEKGRGAL